MPPNTRTQTPPKSETQTPPSPVPPNTHRDKRKDNTDCSHSGHSTPLAVISNWRQLKSTTIVMSERCTSSNSSSSSATFVFGFLLGPGSLSSSLDSSTVSFALKNLIFLAEATGVGSTVDDVEGRDPGECLSSDTGLFCCELLLSFLLFVPLLNLWTVLNFVPAFFWHFQRQKVA